MTKKGVLKHSVEFKERQRLRMLGNKLGVRNKNCVGRVCLDGTRLKMRLSHLGKKLPLGQRIKIGLAGKGRKHTTKFKENLMLKMLGNKNGIGNRSHLGEKQSQETILKRIMRGNKHYNWKGGITPSTNLRLAKKAWKRVADEVRKRDNNICQICGSVGGIKKFAAHHKTPDVLIKNDNLENLITLCPSCHPKEEHKWKQETAFLRIDVKVLA